MAHRIIRPSVLLAAMLLSAGCETIIEPDLPTQAPRLVVYAFFAPGQSWSVAVSHSAEALGSAPIEAVTDATVEVLLDGAVVERLTYAGGGYRSEGLPVGGGVYTLRAEAPGYAPVEATDAVPVPVVASVSSATVAASAKVRTRTFTLRLDDPPGARDFYTVAVTRIDTFATGSTKRIDLVFSTHDPAILHDAEQWDALEQQGTFNGVEAYFTDVFFDGKTSVVELAVSEPAQDPHPAAPRTKAYEVRLRHVSEVLYRFQRTMRRYAETAGNPFAEPVDVFSNVVRGYGVFAGYREQVLVVPYTPVEAPAESADARP